MHLANSLDALGTWRAGLVQRLDELAHFLEEHELADAAVAGQLEALRERLGNEKLVVAFVAEFSRGKSELINAIFFADSGRRILPATPGRTTMCPVEMGWSAGDAPALMLLPIETRLQGLSLAELRGQPRAWRHLELDVDDAERLAHALQEVTRTERVSLEQARALGFWDDAAPDDNPACDAAGMVEVPAWRHALINYPHPLLRQGLVVLDTPGLNAIGAEPELTLSLLPTAHATVFILGADTGVTKSDLAIWRDHLGATMPTRFVVLNKIDALADPLSSVEQVQQQIARQRRDTARTLGVGVERVYPLSARQALAARIAGDAASLQASRLPELETALGAQLLPQRHEVLEQLVLEGALLIETQVMRRLGEGRRVLAEQMLELRGLRGKNSTRVRLMLQRIDAESVEFEQSMQLLQAMRGIHARLLKHLLYDLSTDRLRREVHQMQAALRASMLRLGARQAFVALCGRLHALLTQTRQRSIEIHEMLTASFGRLNAEFGFSLALGKPPEMKRFELELGLIERNYVQYLGLTQALRLAQPSFMEQFRRMLLSKLRVVFENASGEVELWNKATSAQVDAQLRDRRRSFKHRRDTLERVQQASDELESRLAELELQDQQLQKRLAQVAELTAVLREHACNAPLGSGLLRPAPDLLLFDDIEPATASA